MDDDRIIAIGFLNRRDLEVLGEAFSRQIPTPFDDMFAGLLDNLDAVEASPFGNSVVLRTRAYDKDVS